MGDKWQRKKRTDTQKPNISSNFICAYFSCLALVRRMMDRSFISNFSLFTRFFGEPGWESKKKNQHKPETNNKLNKWMSEREIGTEWKKSKQKNLCFRNKTPPHANRTIQFMYFRTHPNFALRQTHSQTHLFPFSLCLARSHTCFGRNESAIFCVAFCGGITCVDSSIIMFLFFFSVLFRVHSAFISFFSVRFSVFIWFLCY